MTMQHCRFIPVLSLMLAAACAPQASTVPGTIKASALERVPVPGGSLEYRVTGTGEPVLLIHGSVFADGFANILNEQALQNYQLITYNRRGFAGSTRATSPFTIEQQTADAIALLDRLGVQRAHIVGHSYGGAIALELARQQPQRVATLALFEAAVPAMGAVDPAFMEGVMAAMTLYQQGDARSALRRFADGVSPGAWDELAAAGATAMQDQAVADAGTFFEVELPAIQLWQFTAADAARLNMPALVVVGGESSAANKSTHSALLKTLPRPEELVVAGAGHELQMKHPTPVASGLGAFLRKHPMR